MRNISPFVCLLSFWLACRPTPTLPPVKTNSAPSSTPATTIGSEPKQLPGLTEVQLDNGLRVYLYELREVPLVSIALVAPAGSAFDTPEKSGLAFLTSRLLSASSGERDAATLREEIDSLGATFSVSSFVDDAEIALGGLSRDLPALLQIVSDVAQRPAFSSEDFEQERELLGEEVVETPSRVFRLHRQRTRGRGHAPRVAAD